MSQKILNQADVLLNLGCRFESMETNWTPDFPRRPMPVTSRSISTHLKSAAAFRPTSAHSSPTC
jgi:thiamine pyrophosphate-dependent acetolactate synthase large subunit-like protein